MRLSKLLAGLAVASVALAACGTSGGGTANKGTIKIGVDLPESGAEASDGIPTLNGVKYAVQTQTNVEGFTIEVSNLEDAVSGVHDPQKGAQNMQQFVSDSKVLGVVGPFNSNVARAEIPISNRAHLAQISPANTNQCLTKNIYIPTTLGAPKDITCKDAGILAPADRHQQLLPRGDHRRPPGAGHGGLRGRHPQGDQARRRLGQRGVRQGH